MHAASMKFPEVDHPPMWVLRLQDKPSGISQKYPTKFLLQAINCTCVAKVSGKMADITLAASSSNSYDESLSNKEVEKVPYTGCKGRLQEHLCLPVITVKIIIHVCRP